MKKTSMNDVRKPESKVDDIFINRWSPRAMSGEKITKSQLMSLFEAGKWAPSCYNAQPWRFIYAMRDTPEWEKFFGLLVDFNKSWCKDAAVLVLIASRKTFEHNSQPHPGHSFDTGAAWENIALQGSMLGLVVHGMVGFDPVKARKDLKVPDGYDIEAMFAVGKPGKKESLPKELQEREAPSQRKKISEIVFEGAFKG